MFDAPTPNLNLPYIMAAQAQKHVTHNEAVRMLDCLVQLMVLSRALATPPATPAEGDRYIVAAAPTGTWFGQTGRIAAFQDGAWTFYVPKEGVTAWVANEDILVAYTSAAWTPVSPAPAVVAAALVNQPVQNVAHLGISATADTTNRLSVNAPATLFNHAGNGHQIKLNKNAAADTASLLLQTNFSGRAEIGTTGDDGLHIKVSANGSTWTEALSIDAASGDTTVPRPLKTSAVRPRTDNSFGLGAAGARFTDVWAVNGIIQTSDAREKTDIAHLEPVAAAATVDALDPVSFRWCQPSADTRCHAGFLAQDVAQVLDAQGLNIAVTGHEDPHDPTSRQWLRPDQLIAILWSAVRTTRQDLARFEARLAPRPA
jgi:Protein of unknown function (DUF2793)/Chaperone of endosialidase